MPHPTQRQPHLHLNTLAALVSAAFALPLAAQTVTPPAQPASAPTAAPDDATNPTVVVSAQRRLEPLQEVPLSVTAISGAQLKNANVTTADRLEQLVPGLRMGRSGSDLRPAMRGTYTENVSATGDPRFGIYIDRKSVV